MALTPLEFAAKILGKIIPPRYWDNHERFFDDSGNFIPDDRVEDPGEIAALESKLRGSDSPSDHWDGGNEPPWYNNPDHVGSRYVPSLNPNPFFEHDIPQEDLDFFDRFYDPNDSTVPERGRIHDEAVNVLSNRLSRLAPDEPLRLYEHTGGALNGSPSFRPSALYLNILKDYDYLYAFGERDGDDPAATRAFYDKWVPGLVPRGYIRGEEFADPDLRSERLVPSIDGSWSRYGEGLEPLFPPAKRVASKLGVIDRKYRKLADKVERHGGPAYGAPSDFSEVEPDDSYDRASEELLVAKSMLDTIMKEAKARVHSRNSD